jgi:hypothetical protein
MTRAAARRRWGTTGPDSSCRRRRTKGTLLKTRCYGLEEARRRGGERWEVVRAGGVDRAASAFGVVGIILASANGPKSRQASFGYASTIRCPLHRPPIHHRAAMPSIGGAAPQQTRLCAAHGPLQRSPSFCPGPVILWPDEQGPEFDMSHVLRVATSRLRSTAPAAMPPRPHGMSSIDLSTSGLGHGAAIWHCDVCVCVVASHIFRPETRPVMIILDSCLIRLLCAK